MIPEESRWIILDEVQKVPMILDEVHRLIESRKLRFVLTGSSARKVRRNGANLLGGRALYREFHPLTCWEIGADFDLRKALRLGMLPNAWMDADPEAFLSTYVHTYLKEEVFAEGLTRNLQAFSRFIEVASFSQAQQVTMASIAQDVGVDSKMIASYMEVLEDLLLAVRLPVFRRRAKRRLASHPKFFLFDCGVFRAIRPKGPLDSEEERDGAALETLFLQHYRALGEFSGWDQELYYWRTSAEHEVDFVSYGPLGLFAFEIKRGSIAREEDLKALRLFKKDYPMAKAFLLYGGTEQYREDGIEILGYEDGIRRMPELIGVSIGSQKENGTG
jgi:predicted AAA+ superfamily ATPase